MAEQGSVVAALTMRPGEVCPALGCLAHHPVLVMLTRPHTPQSCRGDVEYPSSRAKGLLMGIFTAPLCRAPTTICWQQFQVAADTLK